MLAEQFCYHLGSAIDDNPLAVLASQNMQGALRGFIYRICSKLRIFGSFSHHCHFTFVKSYITFHSTVTPLLRKVTSLFSKLFFMSHHFYMKVTSLSGKVISLLQELNETDIQFPATPFPQPTSSPLPSIHTAPKISCCSSACDS